MICKFIEQQFFAEFVNLCQNRGIKIHLNF